MVESICVSCVFHKYYNHNYVSMCEWKAPVPAWLEYSAEGHNSTGHNMRQLPTSFFNQITKCATFKAKPARKSKKEV